MQRSSPCERPLCFLTCGSIVHDGAELHSPGSFASTAYRDEDKSVYLSSYQAAHGHAASSGSDASESGGRGAVASRSLWWCAAAS